MMKNLLLWLVIAGMLVFVFSNFNQQAPTKQLTYSEFVNSVSNGDVKRVHIDGLTISGERTLMVKNSIPFAHHSDPN